MIAIPTLNELLEQREHATLEVKSAQGQDGKGAVPQDIWKTYSAMANTQGGVILLGIKEDADHRLSLLGLKDPAYVQRCLWDQINNRQNVNSNILRSQDITLLEEDGKTIIVITIPRAKREGRPVYIGKNPFEGTYRRNGEGDYRCNEVAVRRMIADATIEARDSQIMLGFTIADLDAESIRHYRNEFRLVNLSHTWNTVDDQEFLRMLGSWRLDRQTGEEGVTLAGLVMFGTWSAIKDAIDRYHLDYQERGRDHEEIRYTDRVTLDGNWSGNVFDFFHRVYPKLTADLKVPFRLDHGKRVDETPIHEALREALVNALIHADYQGTTGILIIKAHDRFIFRNPGNLRLPIDVVYAGGTSDCRNMSLQRMFRMIGAGEQAGSGVPKIQQAWSAQHWQHPQVQEKLGGEQTEWLLSMESMLPSEIVDALTLQFGERFLRLSPDERLTVVTAGSEGSVTNIRLQQLTRIHPHDLTQLLRGLVAHGILEQHGVGRGTYYAVEGFDPSGIWNATLFDGISANSETLSPEQENSSSHSDPISSHSDPISSHSDPISSHSDPISSHSDPISSHSASKLSEEEEHIIQQVAASSKIEGDMVKQAIIFVCRYEFKTIAEIAAILHRRAENLRARYVTDLVQIGRLELRFPYKPTHRDQSYRDTEKR